MTEFGTFFQMGLDHILDIHAYDHLLFMVSLLLVYSFRDLKPILILLTAFTIGHAISLLLGLTGLTPLSAAWIEFLIPLTILAMSIYHLIAGKGKQRPAYLLTLLFGVIHGMAYAKDFLLMMRDAEAIVVPLLGFNLGIEVAQIGFGLIFLAVMVMIERGLRISSKQLHMFIFGAVITLAIQLVIANRIW